MPTYVRTDRCDDNRKCFVNSRYDSNTGKWELKKVSHKHLIKD